MISEIFEKVKSENRTLCNFFVSCGDPSLNFTERLIENIAGESADIITLGVPFSDPMADDFAIQESFLRALENKTNILQILEMSKRLRQKKISTPFVLYGYFNNFLRLGIEHLAKLSRESGINAWAIVDLPLEEHSEILPALKVNSIEFVPFASPNATPERIKNISKSASSFLYSEAVFDEKGIPLNFPNCIEKVRINASLPVATSFAFSNFETAKFVISKSEAIIVASEFVELIHETFIKHGEALAMEEAVKFAKKIRQLCAKK